MTPPPAGSVLERRLGPLDAAVIVISNVIGVGIFTTPGIVATMLPNPVVMLAVWAAGGALAFAGALAYAELAARRPQAGGEYVFLREFRRSGCISDRLDVFCRPGSQARLPQALSG